LNEAQKGPTGRIWTRLRRGRTAVVAGPPAVCIKWRRRKVVPRWLLRTCCGAFALVLLSVVGAGVFMLRLSQGPLAIGGFGKRIEAAIAERLDGHFAVELGAMHIADSEHGPVLNVDGIVLRDLTGRTILQAPQAALSVDPLTLMTGRVVPKRLELQNLELRLSLLPDGSMAVSAGTGTLTPITLPRTPVPPADAAPAGGQAAAAPPASAPDQDPVTKFEAMLGFFFNAAADPESTLGVLERLGVAKGRLVIDNRISGRTTTFEGVDVAFDRPQDDELILSTSAAGPNGNWSIQARMHGRQGEAREVAVEFRDLSLDEWLIATGLRNIGLDTDVPMSGKLTAVLAADGQLTGAQAKLLFGAGYIQLDDPDHEPFMIDEISAALSFDPAARRVNLDGLQIAAGDTQFQMHGTIQPPAGPETAWHMTFSGDDNRFGAERPGEKPIVVSQLRGAAVFEPLQRHLAIERLELTGPELGFVVAGGVTTTDIGTKLSLRMSATRMPIVNAIRLWPSFIIADMRSWFLANIHGGFIDNASLALDFDEQTVADFRAQKPPPDDAVKMQFTVTDGRATTLKGLPPIIALDGSLQASGRTANFVAQRGALELANGRRLNLSEGTFIVDTGQKPAPATLSVRVTGAAETVADLVTLDAIKPFAALPAEPAAIRGQVDGHLGVDLKLGKPAAPQDTAVKVTANVTNLSIDRLVGSERLEAGTLNFSVDRSGLKAKGDGRLFGLPATFELKRNANGPGEAVLNVVLDEATRAKHGFAGVTGPVGARISLPIGTVVDARPQLELDLTKAGMDGLLPGLVKPAGRPAKAQMAISESDGLVLDPFAFESGAIALHGALKLDPDGNLNQVHLAQARLSPGDDMKVEATASGDGYKVVVRGTTIDARPFLQSLTAPPRKDAASKDTPGKDPPSKDIDLDIKTNQLTGHNGQVLTGFELRLVRQASQWQQVQLAGHFARASLTGASSRRDGAQTIAIATADAGAALAFLDYYRRMQGGQLSLSLRPDETHVEGNLQIHNFILKDEPAMRRLFSERTEGASDRFGGPQQKVDSNAVPFTKLSVAFARTGGRIDLRDGVMWGPQVGATVEGSVDFGQDKVNLGGTFVPAYQVNNLFSKIPVFGMLLGGGQNEGLFAINYRVSGPSSAPTLLFNPLSAIAPGFLRKIFGAIDGTNVRSAQPMSSEQSPEPIVR
jgi:hypothetical protein